MTNKVFTMRYVLFLLLTCSFLSSCTEDTDYKKACAEQNWEKAYKIVDGLKEEAVDLHKTYLSEGASHGTKSRKALQYEEQSRMKQIDYMKAKQYVVLQEALSVLEENGKEGIMRIVGIAKEHDAEKWLYSELRDTAKKIGDDDLVQRFEAIIGSDTLDVVDASELDSDLQILLDLI